MSPPDAKRRPAWEPDGAQDQPGEAISLQPTSDRLLLPAGLEDRLAGIERRLTSAENLVVQLIAKGDFCPGGGGHLVHVQVPVDHHLCAACVRRANRVDL